ncbi:MAG TPA: preprotein translocase subunit SecY [Acidimicrobiales bacterium]|nr:preprotein translocase subunit SecY [Acidimicrobiales bacterium]
MLESLLNMFRVGDLRKKIAFTVLLLALYRLGSYIPAPGIDVNQLAAFKQRANEGGVLGMLQLFSGGALTQMAIFALGIMPYITSSIIMQILGVVVPKIEQWQEQGAVGQRKITQWTRYLTIVIAVVQATSFAFLLHNNNNAITGGSGTDLLPIFTPGRVAIVVLSLAAGTALLMWMGELITQRGVGNGMSLLIFASIVSGFPAQGSLIHAEHGWGALGGVVAVLIVLMYFIVFVEQGQRRIPVQFAKRVVGRRQYGGQSTYIPLKVNQSGVIPLIFASSVLYLPQLLAVALPWDGLRSFVDKNLSSPHQVGYLVIFSALIVGFAYFYTAISFDPAKQADTIRKQGGYIPGIRPGPQTERYLSRILSRITLPGALFIAAVAIVPSVIISVMFDTETASSSRNAGSFRFIGTSILIAVGVALETMKQIDSQLTMRNYEGFLK